MAKASTFKPDTPNALRDMFVLYNVWQNWGNMSPAQKARTVGVLGSHGFQFAGGDDLLTKPILSNAAGETIISAGDSLNLFNRGFNAYALAQNWDSYNNIQRLIGGSSTALDVAKTAKDFNLLGSGTTGKAVEGVSAQALANSGWSSMPNMGIGAITAEVGAQIPKGYSVLPMSGGEGVVAIPTNNMSSGLGAISSGEPAVATVGEAAQAGALTTPKPGINTLGAATGAITFAAGAYSVYKGWGAGGTKGGINGVLGGSAMAAGLYGMASSGLIAASAANPFVLGGVIALSTIGGAWKRGKGESHLKRDAVRSFLRDKGIVDKGFHITLPDGSLSGIWQDRDKGRHSFKNPDLVTKEHANQGRNKANSLNAYDTDYTNDLDYFSGTAGSAFVSLLAGGKGTPLAQTGGQIGNAILQGVGGYGQEFTESNFNKVRQSYISLFSKAGIKSKADAYQLVNQMFAEHRINDADAASFHQVMDMVYDSNGYERASSLMAGRHKGIELAVQDQDVPDVQTTSIPGAEAPVPLDKIIENKPIKNTGSIQLKVGRNSFMNPPAEFKGKEIKNLPMQFTSEEGRTLAEALPGITGKMRTKEDVIKANQEAVAAGAQLGEMV